MSAVLSGYKRGVYAQVMEGRDRQCILVLISFDSPVTPLTYAYSHLDSQPRQKLAQLLVLVNNFISFLFHLLIFIRKLLYFGNKL